MSGSAIRQTSRRKAEPVEFQDAWTPGDLVQFEALVSACALVAQSDGWVTPEETRRVSERMRTLPALDVFGVEDVIEAFEARIADFNRDPDRATAIAEASIRRLKEKPAAARAVAAAACAVASADGGFDAEERKVVLRICAILILSPQDLDLVAPRRRR
ncbi:MAG: tellurite resistance TerB family protein [Phenylobacterium sp.]